MAYKSKIRNNFVVYFFKIRNMYDLWCTTVQGLSKSHYIVGTFYVKLLFLHKSNTPLLLGSKDI